MRFGSSLNRYCAPGSGFDVTDLSERTAPMDRAGFDGAALGEHSLHGAGSGDPLTALSVAGYRGPDTEPFGAQVMPVFQ